MSAFAGLWYENLDDEWDETGDPDELREIYGYRIDNPRSVLHAVVSEFHCDAFDAGYHFGKADGRREAEQKAARASKRAAGVKVPKPRPPAPPEQAALFEEVSS